MAQLKIIKPRKISFYFYFCKRILHLLTNPNFYTTLTSQINRLFAEIPMNRCHFHKKLQKTQL
jgi:hypothetical protein